MKIWKAYKAYINDNPEGYWFRRKIYGWGWTPATKEGWFVILGFLAFIIFIAWRAENNVTSDKEALVQVLLPLIAGILSLIVICYKTGEPPRWQWRIPKRYFKD